MQEFARSCETRPKRVSREALLRVCCQRATVCAALGWLALLVSAAADATVIETLIMPGPVIQGHAEYEATCEKCHETFSKSDQTRLCLDCHESTAGDIDRGEGFHGRAKNLAQTDCSHCHTDHVGRDADIVGLVMQTFDHGATDFRLEGAHKAADCGGCHLSGKKFREAPAECIECHRANDAHQGRMGEQCNDCHGEQTWAEARYDHDKTEFPLEEKHRDTACNACHPSERYQDTPKDCNSCHRLNDSHLGHFGDRCDTCHSPKEWKPSSFDHDRDTEFRLTGRHSDASCNACHQTPLYEKKLASGCADCHRSEDVHKGRNGADCRKCHGTGDWRDSRFRHDKDTDFPLRGKHADLVCETCHRGAIEEQELEQECYACHRQDDVHEGQEGEHCQQCHNEHGWGQRVAFDHDLAGFPLLGQHAIAACESCHLTQAYLDTPKACRDCHGDDDAHDGVLGTECNLCHNPNDWRLWQFDHDSQTEYPLEGAHDGLVCHACHNEPVGSDTRVPKDCVGCHRTDDIHHGEFGNLCSRCHTTESFRNVRITN